MFAAIVPEKFYSFEEKEENLTLKVRRSKICSFVENFGNGWPSEIAVPYLQTKEEEISFVLEKEKQNKSRSSKYIYLRFYTTEETFCLFEGKYTLIGKNTVWGNTYVFDGSADQYNEIHIIPAGELPKFTDVKKWDPEVVKVINEDPERISLLCLRNTKIIWLDNFFRVSELSKI